MELKAVDYGQTDLTQAQAEQDRQRHTPANPPHNPDPAPTAQPKRPTTFVEEIALLAESGFPHTAALLEKLAVIKDKWTI